jgi:Ca2+-binding RTX toxin-like protein
LSVTTAGSVNTAAIGSYERTYTANDAAGNQASAKRTITVADTRAPVVTLAGASTLTLECGVDTYTESGASALDSCAGNLSVTIAGSVNTGAVGNYERTYTADDTAGHQTVAKRTITVADTRAPVLTAVPTVKTTCVPEPSAVTLSLPTVQEACDHATVLTGAVISVNNKTLATPIAINMAAPTVTLPIGSASVRWTATDAQGHQTVLVQTVTLTVSDEPAVCCAPGQTVTVGTSGVNIYLFGLSPARCVFGKDGDDQIITGLSADVLSGGDAQDLLTSTTGSDVAIGGAGNDWIDIGSGKAYGGAGNDVINIGAGTVYGGAGDDHIDGNSENQVVYPGPGRDNVNLGLGDDTVVILDVCEVSNLEVLDAGLGYDTLITPVPVSELIDRGVILLGFNNIVVASDKRHLSECF